MPSFRCYGRYCSELSAAIAKIQELISDRKIATAYEQAKEQSGQKFGLKDLMHVPMQRVLKYPLLLKVGWIACFT